jgi:hypothetical protein
MSNSQEERDPVYFFLAFISSIWNIVSAQYWAKQINEPALSRL